MFRHAAILVGLCGLTFLAGLGQPALTDSDEAFYAESAREMIERDDWLTPYFNGQPRFEKPVLYYWLAALTYQVAGVAPWTARLPSALAGFGLVFVAWACARRYYGDATALVAGVVTATSFAAIAMAHQSLPDLPLAFFIALSTWAWLVGLLEEPANDDGVAKGEIRRRAWLIVAAVAAAGAFLMKGPVGPLLVALAVVPAAAFDWWRGGSVGRARPVDVLAAAAAFLLLALPWYGAMAMEHGAAYLDRFFLAENFDRFATDRYNDPRPVWYYLPIVAGGMLPWTPFTMFWIPALRRAWEQRDFDTRTVRLVVWAAVPLLLYTLSVGKQPRYILPMLVPMGVLIGRAITQAMRADATETDRRLFAAAGVAAGVAVALIGASVWYARSLLIEQPGMVISYAAAVIATAGGVAVAVTLRAAWKPSCVRAVPIAIAAASVVAATAAYTIVLSGSGPAPVERMASLVSDARQADEPYGRYRVFDRNLVYYVGTPHTELVSLEAVRDFLRSPERVLVVLRSDDAETLVRWGVRFTRIGDVSYVNTGNFNLRTFREPDPDRYVLTVLLVTNRQELAADEPAGAR